MQILHHYSSYSFFPLHLFKILVFISFCEPLSILFLIGQDTCKLSFLAHFPLSTAAKGWVAQQDRQSLTFKGGLHSCKAYLHVSKTIKAR